MSVAAFRPLAMARTTRLAPLAASPATNTLSANWGCSGFRNPIARRTRSASITSTFPVGFMTGRPRRDRESIPPVPLPHRTLYRFCLKTYGWRETIGGCTLLRERGGFQYDGELGPWSGRILSYGRLGHDFYLGDA